MKDDWNFFIASGSFLAATLCALCTHIGASFAFLLFVLGLALFFYRARIISDEKSKAHIAVIIVAIIFCGVGIIRTNIATTYENDSTLQTHLDSRIVAEGIVIAEPDTRLSRNLLTVSLSDIVLGTTTIPVSGTVLVSAGLYPAVSYGDKVQVSGTFAKPDFISTSTNGSIFDYSDYLALRGISYEMNFASVSVESSGNGNPVVAFLLHVRDDFITNMNRLIAEPEASLASGILLGAQSAIGSTLSNTFRSAGLSHIVVLSGYNITVVASALVVFFSFLPRIVASSFGIVGIFLFVIMSGASATAIRAGIMAVIAMLSRMTYRPYHVGRALIAAVAILVFINPPALLFDLSFQLSVLATVAIVYMSPIFERMFTRVSEKFGLRSMIATTLAAEIAVAPLILYSMGSFSLVGIPANVLVFFVMPITMLVCFIVGVFGTISSILVLPFAWIAWILLAYIIGIANFFAGLPFATLSVTWFSLPCMIFLYACIILWTVVMIRKNKIS